MKFVRGLMFVLVALMVAVLFGVAITYVVGGPFHFWNMPVPKNASVSTEWANFGVFFGGIAGPLLTAISSVVLALGFVLQANALNLTFKQVGMAAAHESLSWGRQRLEAVLQRPLGPNNKTVQDLAVANAQGRTPVLSVEEEKALTEVLPELLYWLSVCVEQVKLFQANHNPHDFTVRHESVFYHDLLKFVLTHKGKLPGTLTITAGLLETHFRK